MKTWRHQWCSSLHLDDSVHLHTSASARCIPFLILFLLFLLLCSYLSCSLISARIRSKNITPETQLSHWAKCAAHKLRYPSKAFHTPNLLSWFFHSVLSPLTVCFIHVLRLFVLLFLLSFFFTTIILEIMWNECSQHLRLNEKDCRENDEAIHIHNQSQK